MATSILCPLPGWYIDDLQWLAPTANIHVINTIPENGETRVKPTAAIELHIVDTSGALNANALVYVTDGSGAAVLAYDQAGGGFQAGFTGALSSATVRQSPGSGVDDELVLVIDPDPDLTPGNVITVRATATGAGGALDTTYTFTLQDTAAPTASEILWVTPRMARVRFRDEMQNDTEVYGTRFLVDLTGGMEITGTDTLTITGQDVSSSWIGYWCSITGSAYPQNNHYFKVASVNATLNTVTVDLAGGSNLVPDDGKDLDDDGNLIRHRSLRCCISPYRIRQRGEDETTDAMTCAYEPTIIGIREAEAWEIVPSDSLDKYIFITTHDDVSIRRMYEFSCLKVKDVAGFEADATSLFDFTTPGFGAPTDRIQLWSERFFPEIDQDEDLNYTRELERMAVVLQDAINLLWVRCDWIPQLTDPDKAPAHWIDHLLYSLGNVFTFPMTELEKRRLCLVLQSIYQQAGLAKIIEWTIEFFLGISVTVVEYINMSGWIIGTSYLSVDTYLTANSSYIRNCYEVQSPVELTELQKRLMTNISEALDPADMHLWRIKEPSDPLIWNGAWAAGIRVL